MPIATEAPPALPPLPDAPQAAAAEIAGLHPADGIEALNRLTPEAAAAVIRELAAKTAVPLFNTPGLSDPSDLLHALPHDLSAAILAGLHPDRRAEVARGLTEADRADLVEHLPPAVQKELAGQLAYPMHSAGSIMTTSFLALPTTMTVEQAMARIREIGSTLETIYAIYLIDPADRALRQVISLRELVQADPKASLAAAANPRPPISVVPTTDREDVARIISKYDLLAVPVLDSSRHVVGIVTVDDVIDAVVQEATEDVQKLGGTEALEEPYMRVGFVDMLKKRAGWLCALFLSEMLTASAMQHYESALEKAVMLTLFIPLIMSSGGNSGSQATSLIIRALALREVRLADWWRVVLRELPTGLALGAILGVIGVARITLWQKLGIFDYGEHWPLVALTVGTALVGIVTFGSVAGSMLPFILKRLGFDPASASAPFVATLVDVTGLVIYFSVAYVILRGTLL
jgi:magnesium transporter